MTKSKTEAGTGRVVPLNNTAVTVLTRLADRFPDRRDEHFVFAAERYGVAGDQDADHALRRGSVAADTQLERGLGEREAPGAGRVPIPRLAAHRRHADAGRRGSARGRREHPRLERLDDRAHGEALRAHRQQRAAQGRRSARADRVRRPRAHPWAQNWAHRPPTGTRLSTVSC